MDIAAPTSVSARDVRKIILQQSARAHVGHIGSALSVADILAVLYGGVLRLPNWDDADRDRFIMSKGHAALALYAALFLRGAITEDELGTFCGDDSLLGVHPSHELAGVDFSTGSLGMGLSYGAGAALAARFQKSARRVFVLISDAECNEGTIWEAAMFAAHHRLANLCVIVDANGQQALGHTRDVLNLEPLRARWEAFGWDVAEVDGHDATEMSEVFRGWDYSSGRPHAMIARTVFGHGVSYMQNQIQWHYLPMSDVQFGDAMTQIESS
jgi:transketolase